MKDDTTFYINKEHIMTLRIQIIFSIIFISIFSTPAFSLGKLSHQLVCQLSYDLLPSAKQQKIDELLSQLSIKDQKRINKYNRNKENQKITFAESCTWADAIKKDKSFNHFKPWHYLNIERNTLSVTKETCSENCVTAAIPFHKNQLISAENAQEKAEALMFLGHWLGDIHQPLHVSFSSDYGGNRNKIKPLVGRCENLHWYWDECLLYSIPKKEDKAGDFDYLAFKTAVFQQLSHILASSPKTQWADSDMTDWANESLTLIREKEFNYCQLSADNCLSKQNDKVVITEAYHQHYQAILHKRMLQAAVRLSSLLSQAL